jgi:hypothetical protein
MSASTHVIWRVHHDLGASGVTESKRNLNFGPSAAWRTVQVESPRVWDTICRVGLDALGKSSRHVWDDDMWLICRVNGLRFLLYEWVSRWYQPNIMSLAFINPWFGSNESTMIPEVVTETVLDPVVETLVPPLLYHVRPRSSLQHPFQ